MQRTLGHSPPPLWSDIKNTITIFHHLWQVFESADKLWLHYYFHSDKQSNIFYSSEFHLICHDTLHCILVALKTASNLMQALSVIQSHIWVPAFNPTLSQNTLYVSKLLCDPLLNVQAKSQCYSFHNELFFFSFWQMFAAQCTKQLKN